MLDMGLVRGAEVEVVRVAPLGDPIEFTVKGYNLSLRKSEAQKIEIEA
jgi:ferrous iron transport protein A